MKHCVHLNQVPARITSRHLGYALSLLGLACFLVFIYRMTHPVSTLPLLSIHFTGEIWGGLHRNPFGQFLISSLVKRPLRWSRADVEAPLDADLAFSASVDSNIPVGTLQPGAIT